MNEIHPHLNPRPSRERTKVRGGGVNMKEFKFEEAMKRLEEIVQKLEEGNLTLEKSLELFEEGVKLSRFCTKKLEEAHTKIDLLTKNPAGKAELKPFKGKEEDGGNGEKEGGDKLL